MVVEGARSRNRMMKNQRNSWSAFKTFLEDWAGARLIVWVARQNEAAGAADAAAWVMSAVLIFSSDNLWVTRRCPCDPSTQNDAGGTPGSKITALVLGLVED